MNKKDHLKIVIVNPPSKFLIDEKVFLPLGLLTLVSVMKNEGYKKIEFIDLAGKNEIPKVKGDIFFFTATTPQVHSAKEIMNEFKKVNITSKYIIGGPHATVKYDDLMSFDSIVQGEGEKSVLKILNDFPNLRKIYIEDKIENLDIIPFPDRDIIDIKQYANNYLLNGEPTTTYVTSRGCSYGRCAFCCRNYSGVRYRSAQNVFEEIKTVQQKYGINGAMFFDDEFVSNKKRLKEICRLIKPLNIKWRCLARVNSIDEDIIPIMKDAGCVEIGIGIESANEEILNNISKGIHISKAKQAVKIVKKSGIKVKELFIIGLPGESKESIEEIDNFVRLSKPDDVDFTVLSVFPGSEIFQHPENYDIKFNPKCLGWYKGVPGDYKSMCKISTSKLTFDEIVAARNNLESKYKPKEKLYKKTE